VYADEEKWDRPGGSGRRMPDPGMVAAARDGDARALDALVADVLPLVYNIVGRALDGHADVDDVVQETLLRVVRGLNGLREPEAFRSWLVAIAIRQVRDREQERRKAFVHSSALDTVQDVPDPSADFVSAGIRSLSLADRRRVVTSAMRWLDAENRTLLALWWLEEIGELERTDLAAAIGLSVRHTAVRVLRMKEQMQVSCMVAKALQAQPGCQKLHEITQGWDLDPNPLWRKRIARHVRGCDTCWNSVGDLLPVDGMVRSLPLLPVPIELARRWGASMHGLNGSAHTAIAAANHGATHGGATFARHARHLATKRPRGLFGTFAHSALAPVTTAAVVVGATVGTVLAVQPSGAPVAKPAITTPAYPASPSPSPSPSASASPSPSVSPSPSPSPKPSSVAAVPPVKPAVPQGKKGVSVWTFNGVNSALAQSKADWYYTWSTSHSGITSPSGVGFVPMIWGAGSVTASNLAQAKAAGPYLLGFNEPDMAAQSNMTVDQALSLWPQLMATGSTLGSPAVATGAATSGGWLDQFMSGAQAKGYRVDFITLHWYGGDFNTADAVSQLKSYVQAVYNRYHKPIWLTEYALIDFSHGTTFPSDQQQAAFVTASAQMLSSLSYLQRYAWFALPASDTAASSGLFHSGPTVTPEGQAFEAAAGG
jgi:RNA polymerase sigma factor (sigma-70 family)